MRAWGRDWGRRYGRTWGDAAKVAAPPLDAYPGAYTAYSMRKLATAYAGQCLRLRRSTDNVESDFGFAGGWLDSVAVIAWLGGATGFVTTWYDQSGNARHAIQGTAVNQPVLDLTGLRPFISSTGASQCVERAAAPLPTSGQTVTIAAVLQIASGAGVGLARSWLGGSDRLLIGSSNFTIRDQTSANANAAVSTVTKCAVGAERLTNQTSDAFKNGVLAGTASFATAGTFQVTTGGIRPASVVGLSGEFVFWYGALYGQAFSREQATAWNL